MCLGAWFMSSMAVLHFASRDPYAGSTDLLNTTWYMKHKEKKAFSPEAPWLEMSLQALSAEAHIRIWGNLRGAIKERWDSILPNVVEIGGRLCDDAQLERHRREASPACDGFDHVFKAVGLAMKSY